MKRPLERFDDYLREKLKDPKYRRGYEKQRLAVFVGYDLYQLRKRLGLTQAEMARRMGTHQQAVARLEKGDDAGFTLKTLQRIAEATKTELVIEFRPRREKRGKLGA